MVGFEMESVKENIAPVLFVQVYRKKNNVFATKMQKHSVGNNDKFDFYQIENGEVFAWYETSLLHFLTANNQKEQMVAWFSEKLANTKSILESL